jgi:ABC-type transport system involved in multi-copper enzyme maturation permease subunit
VHAVRLIEQQAMALLTQNGASATQAAQAFSLASQRAYQDLLHFFANTEALDPTLRDSVILPAYLWGSLAFMPFLVLLTSFDMISTDLGNRAICYATTRVPRLAVLLGKMAAQAVLFATLMIIGSLVLVGLAASMLESFSLADTLLGLARLWALLVPYGLCYLGVSAFASSSTRQAGLALFLALGIVTALRICSWMGAISPESSVSFLRQAQWLSPATYQTGMWEEGLTQPALSALAYLAFGAVFTVLAARALLRRDL